MNPHPSETMVTFGSFSTIASTSHATLFQTSGSDPDPICVWSFVIVRSYLVAISFTFSKYSCQIPKLDAGPQTFVRFVPPDPIPGLTRMEVFVHGKSFPYVSS